MNGKTVFFAIYKISTKEDFSSPISQS